MPGKPERTRPGEFELIARLFAPLAAGWPGACGLVDDVAYLPLKGDLIAAGEELVLKSDAIVAGVHFLDADPPDLVARKLLRVNLSDLAAKGARPLLYTLTIMLPATVEFAWLERFAEGLGEDQATFGLHLAGGDTNATPGPLALAVTMLGAVPAGRRLLRAGAKAGDAVFVSGTIGDGALGLKAIQGGLAGLAPHQLVALTQRYRLPEPRLALGARLRGLAHATMDISDGLVGDLEHICTASRVGAIIEAARVPLSDPARAAIAQDPALIESVLGGGDDYELLLTAPIEAEGALAALGRELGVPIVRIGRVVAGQGVQALDGAGHPLKLARTGFRHF